MYILYWLVYGLDNAWFESREGQEAFPFPENVQTVSVAHSASHSVRRGSTFPARKAAEAWSQPLKPTYCPSGKLNKVRKGTREREVQVV